MVFMKCIERICLSSSEADGRKAWWLTELTVDAEEEQDKLRLFVFNLP